MILMEEQQNSSTKQRQRVEIPFQSSYLINRVFYSFILIVILLLISLYFDLLHQYDAVSLVLGFVICIILQFMALSYYFKDEINKYKMDQISILKMKIKVLFGQLDPRYVQKKNIQKYYRHEGNENDKLFLKQNEQIYLNVMTYLRSKQQQNFNELNDKNKQKWGFLNKKVKLLQDLLNDMIKQYEKRAQYFNNYRSNFNKTKQTKDFVQWQQLLKYSIKLTQKQDHTNTSFYSQYDFFNQGTIQKSVIQPLSPGDDKPHGESQNEMIGLNWEILNWFILQKGKITQKEIVCLKQQILPQYIQYIKTIKEKQATNSSNRNSLLQNYNNKKKQKNQLITKIQQKFIQYNNLKDYLGSNRIKQKNDVETILKTEFNLKLIKIQLQNFEVKMSKIHGLIIDASQKLYNHVQQQTFELQEQVININNKFQNYITMFAGIGEQKTPKVQKYFDEKLKQYNIQQGQQGIKSIQEYISPINSRKKYELSFKTFLNAIKKLMDSLSYIYTQSDSLISHHTAKFQQHPTNEKRGQIRIKQESSDAKIHYYANNIKDLKMVKLFERISMIQSRNIKKMADIIGQQLRIVKKFEDDEYYNDQYKKICENFRKQDQQLRKIKKKGKDQEFAEEINSIQSQRAKQYQRFKLFVQKYKMESCLYEIVNLMLQNQREYAKYANELAEQEAEELKKQKKNHQSLRNSQKYNAYLNSLNKQGLKQFDEESLNNLKNHQMFGLEQHKLKRENIEIWSSFKYSLREGLQKQNYKDISKVMQHYTYKQSKDKSNEMINRLLCIFIDQWSKSQFFHTFVKQELRISLNRKLPGFVDQLNIDYLKIAERDKKENIFKILKVHQSQIYRCVFDLVINFKGIIVVQIGSKLKIGKGYPIKINLQIKQFYCPIRICFTPYSLGKSYASLLERPKLSIALDVQLSEFRLTKIPFFFQIIKLYLVLKLRKKMLWPKRMTVAVPLSFKSTLDLAIHQRIRYERDRQKLQKKNL